MLTTSCADVFLIFQHLSCLSLILPIVRNTRNNTLISYYRHSTSGIPGQSKTPIRAINAMRYDVFRKRDTDSRVERV